MADSDRSPKARLIELLKEHNFAFTVVLFAYGLVGCPLLRAAGYYELAVVVGVLFLGLMMLALRANVERARERLQGDDGHERRGF